MRVLSKIRESIIEYAINPVDTWRRFNVYTTSCVYWEIKFVTNRWKLFHLTWNMVIYRGENSNPDGWQSDLAVIRVLRTNH